MTHIVHIIEALSLGGAARSMIAVAKYSSRFGEYRHSVIALQTAEEQAVALAHEANMDVLVQPDEAELIQQLRDADIVQVQYWNSPLVYSLLHRIVPPMRLIMWYHIAGNGSPQIITPALAAFPDINIPCNPFSCYDLPVFRDMPAEQKKRRAVLAYDAADFDRVRSVVAVPHTGFNVGYIGTVDFVKMHKNFVPMSAAVNVPGVQFIVCGGGIENELRGQAASLGAAERFDFRGYVQDIAAVIATLDVYGYPLCEDTYAAAELNLQEVMYAGVPPVVFPHGGIKRLVEHNKTGLVVHSEREYTEAIEYLYRHPEERVQLGKQAAEYARRIFGAENAARIMNNVYSALAAQPKRQHTWGRNPDIPLIEQPIVYSDIAEEQEQLSGAQLFVESLGDTATDFATSLTNSNVRAVVLAERRIMDATHLVLQTGLVPYREFAPNDPHLHLWTGLAYEGRHRDAEALSAYVQAAQHGIGHWRVYWYMARVLQRNGRTNEAAQLYTQLRASTPDFDELLHLYDVRAEQEYRSVEMPVEHEVQQPSSSAAEELFNEIMSENSESTAHSDAHTALSREELFAELLALEETHGSGTEQSDIIVSAIVSTYNSERYIEGCLQDLIAQTLYSRGALEIIVVDSGSQQNEGAIVQRYAEQYPNIRYIRTERETIYAAWNRGVQAASGRYLTNANTDDRHKKTALERMAAELDRRADIALVYADSFVTERENEQFDTATISAVLRYPQFDRKLLFQLCYIGPHPMWRKSLHERYGLFDAAMKSAGDYDFWLRISLSETLHHLPETLGLYLRSENSVEWSNVGLMHEESRVARSRYWPEHWGQPPVPQGSFYIQIQPVQSDEALPTVSVIIPTYNRLQTLHEALASLEQQVFKNFEVIVVNDAGEDIEAVVEGFRKSLRIRSVHHSDNRGLPASRNTGLRVARGTYIAYLDDDDVYYPQHLEVLVHAAELSGSKVVYSNAVHLQFRNEDAGRVVVSKDVPYAFDFSRERFLYENYIPVLCVMHERACLDEVGMFDESFRKALEDWDLWVRMSQRYEFFHANVITCEFRTCVDPKRLAALDRSGFAENSRRIFEKYRHLTAQRPDIQRLQQGYLTGLEHIEKQNRARAVQVSIIIPTLNNIDYTRQCISAIQQTAGDVSYEIIVVDNGSTDGTREYLRTEMQAGYLRALFNERNETFSHANNQGAAIAHGAYLLFLNNDTKPLSGWLRALVDTFEQNSRIGVQGGRLLYPNNTIQHAGIVYGRVKTGALMHYHIYLCAPQDAPYVNKAREFQMVTGAMIAIRRELFERIGGFDEHYVFGHEDLDLCLSARKHGNIVWYNPLFAAYHFESMTKKSEGIEKFELRLQDPNSIDAKNYFYFHEKWKGVLVTDADSYYTEDGLLPANTGEQSTGHPRILMTMYGWRESGGGTTFPRAVARRYAALGYEVAVFYAAGIHPSNPSPYHIEEAIEEGVRLFGVYNRPTVFLDIEEPAREIYDSHIVQLFARVAEFFRPDIIHFHNFLGLSFAIADEAKRRGIPTLYTPHNYHMIDPALYMFRSDLSLWKSTNLLSESEIVPRLPEKSQAYRQRMSAAQRLLTSVIDHTIAVSHRQRDILAEFCGDSSRISVVQQVHETAERIQADKTIRRKTEGVVRFGFIGGAMPHKGVHILAQAAQVLRGKAEVWIYGFTSDQYRAQVEQIDKYRVVQWKGAYSETDLPAIAASLDAIVVPSVWEDCAPLVVVEAMAMRLPVIGARIGGIPDVVQNGVNGRLYDYNHPEQLAALLLHYAERPNELRRMADQCNVPYGFSDYIQHMLALYGRMMRKEHITDSDISLDFTTAGTSINEERMDTAMNRIQFSHTLHGGFSNHRATGVLPRPLPQPLYLNVGCGRDVREDCINIDLFSDDPRVVGMDVRKLDLPDNCADGIIASDILEHFSHREVDTVLKEWARVLRPGGELVVRCPSLRLQVQAYMNGVWDADVASYMIFGGQTNPGDYHCIGFDERSIRKHLAQAGLEVFFFEEVDTPQTQGFINLNMTVRAQKKPPIAAPMSTLTFSGQSAPRQVVAPVSPVSPPVPPVSRVVSPAAVTATSRAAGHTAVEKNELNIVWEGSQFVAHSLALINREHCYNIARSGVADLTIVPYEIDEFSAQGNAKYEQLQALDIRYKTETPTGVTGLPHVWIRHQWPPKFDPPKGARWVVMQPWEFSALRKDFVEAFRHADEVWVPSTFVRDVFVESGIDANKVQVVPNGIDPALFTPYGSKAPLPTRKNFRFLFVGGTIFRKGIDVLLDAYAQQFTADDDVCLVIKDMGGKTFYRGQTAQQMIDDFRRKPNAPEVVYIDKTLTEEEMAELYRACHVFVSPYRGEGFSIPTLEAMACGLPVIVTDGGATDDFVDDSTGWLIPAGQRSLGSVIDGHALTGEAFVLEPQSDVLASLMDTAFNRPAESAMRGRMGSLRARTQWTWNRATLKMLSRLDALYGTDMARRAESVLADRDDSVVTFCRAEQAYVEGRVDDAIALYQSAVEQRGLPVEYVLLTLHRLASLALVDGEPELAEEFLEKARTVDNAHPDTLYVQSLVHAWRENWEAELDILEPLLDGWKVVRLKSRIGVELDALLCDMGRALYYIGAMEDAKEVYTLALGVNNENPDACYGSALCFLELGAADEARTMLEWAVRLRPDFVAAREALEELNP